MKKGRGKLPSLTNVQKKGIEKLGQVLCPGNATLPSFTDSKVVDQAERCFSYLTREDQEGLGLLLQILGFLPAFVARFLLWLVDTANQSPSFIAPTLRLLQVGLKGFVYSLYYSDGRVRSLLGWNTKCTVTSRSSE